MVYEANPLHALLDLWEEALNDKIAHKREIEGQIYQLALCMENLKRNLKETPRPVSAEELAELDKD